MKKNKILLTLIICLTGSFSAAKTYAQGTTIFESICPDKSKPNCQQAKKMIENMTVAAMGVEIPPDAWVSAANRMLDNKIVTEAKMKQGISFDDALAYWKSYLASDYYSPATRVQVINRVLLTVYGRNVTVSERPQYEKRFKNQTLWYDRMFEEELKKLNEDGQLRKETINRSYYSAFGRNASILETNNWQSKKNYYREMIDSLRTQLYSKEGGVELLAVVTRYIESLSSVKQLTTNYNETLKNFKQNKWTYENAPR